MEDWDSEKMERQSVNGLQVTSCRLTPYDLRLTISGRDEDRGLEKKYVEGLRIAAPRTIQYRASLSEPWAIRARGLRLEANSQVLQCCGAAVEKIMHRAWSIADNPRSSTNSTNPINPTNSMNPMTQ